MTEQTVTPVIPVPQAAWGFAWSCVVGEMLTLAHWGPQDQASILPSMVLGAAVVAWFSYGVLTGRTVRLAIVVVIMVLAAVVGVVEALTDPTPWAFVELVATITQLACLRWFTTSEFFAAQRARPGGPRPSLAGVMVLAVCVGLLGGVVGTPGDATLHVQFDAG